MTEATRSKRSAERAIAFQLDQVDAIVERLGTHSVVLSVELGEGAVVGAKSLVLRDVAPGAAVAGIPCNTVHAPPIMDVIEQRLAASTGRLRLLHMINEVAQMLQRRYPSVKTVGVLSTIGTTFARVYPLTLEPLGYEVIDPDDSLLKGAVHPAIYDTQYGIKACGYATEKAREDILLAVDHLGERGAQAIILGCTELPLALSGKEIDGLPLIDSTMVLARALIRAVDPQKLLPWEY